MPTASTSRFAFVLMLSLIVISGLAGCVRRERYDEALTANHVMLEQNAALAERTTGLERELSRIHVEMQKRDDKIGELTTQSADTTKKMDDLSLLNAELSTRLKAAGQSVEQLAGERGTMTKTLEDLRTKLEELRRQQAAAEQSASQYRTLLKSLQKMVDAGKLKIAVRRGHLLIELPNDVLFDSGKTAIKEVGQASIRDIASALAGMKDRMFQVAGHTDDRAMKSARYPSNWELSTARAVEVTKLLIESGMAATSLSAAGYGEFAPIADNASDEGRAKNRRIEIALVPNLEEMVKLPAMDAPRTPAAVTTPSIASAAAPPAAPAKPVVAAPAAAPVPPKPAP